MRALKAFAIVAVLGAVLAVPVAAATESIVRADIPFEFVAGEVTLPAGTYVFERCSSGSLLTIWSTENDARKFVLVTPVYQLSRGHGGASVVFNKHGDRHFLSVVWSAGDVAGRSVPKSRLERELSAQSPAQAPVVVAAR